MPRFGPAMAYEVVFDPQVTAHVDEVVGYLTDVLASPAAAAGFLNGLDEVVERLESLPLSYPHPFDARLAAREYRKALVGNYVLLFRVEETGDGSGVVCVTNLFHGSQNYQELL